MVWEWKDISEGESVTIRGRGGRGRGCPRKQIFAPCSEERNENDALPIPRIQNVSDIDIYDFFFNKCTFFTFLSLVQDN